MSFDLGIDLGTTNTAAYYSYNGQCEFVPFDGGLPLLPSCVEYRRGNIYVGATAKNSFRNCHSEVITNAKRIIGRPFNSVNIEDMKEYCGLEIVDIGGKPHFHLERENIDVSPEEVASIIVKKVIECAYQKTKARLGKILVTIPAQFDNNQRTATRTAVEKAINSLSDTIPISSNIKIEMINEPSAAGYCYGLDNNANNQHVLVYDFGGGTFDCSILEIRHGVFKVLESEGNDHLGGVDIDKAVCNFFEEKYQEQYGEPAVSTSLPLNNQMQLRKKIQSEAEQQKINLSNTLLTSVTFSDYCHMVADSDGEYDDEESFDFSRSELNDLMKDIIDKTIEVVRRCLNQHGFSPRDIDHVIMVGGSSLIPLTADRLKEMFGEEKIRRTVDPSLCVAKGGCMYLQLTGGGIDAPTAIADITTTSLETSIYGNRCVCMIPKGAKIPYEHSEIFHPSMDYMTRIHSDLLQARNKNSGEVSNIDEEMSKIGGYDYVGFRQDLRQNISFEETYTIKQSGIVHIKCVEVETGNVLYDEDMDWAHV